MNLKPKNRIILKFTSSSIQTLTVGAVVSTAQSGDDLPESRTLPPVGNFTLP
jgi:hypothetical protein